jgi:hypothetical protein
MPNPVPYLYAGIDAAMKALVGDPFVARFLMGLEATKAGATAEEAKLT